MKFLELTNEEQRLLHSITLDEALADRQKAINEYTLNEMVRDFTQVTPRPKSEVKRRIKEYIRDERFELELYLKVNMKNERLIDDRLMHGYLIALNNINKFYENNKSR